MMNRPILVKANFDISGLRQTGNKRWRAVSEQPSHFRNGFGEYLRHHYATQTSGSENEFSDSVSNYFGSLQLVISNILIGGQKSPAFFADCWEPLNVESAWTE